MSWIFEVLIHDDRWYAYPIRFPNKIQAHAHVANLMRRCRTIRAIRIAESPEPFNFHHVNGALVEADGSQQRADNRKTAIVVASGRSVSNVCLPLLSISRDTLVAVNNAVNHVPFADYVFTLDTTDLHDRMKLPSFEGQRVAAVPVEHFLGKYARSFAPDDSPSTRQIHYLTRIPFTSIDRADGIMTGCSGFGAVQFAYKFLGAKEIILLGCDHDEQGRYFYGDDSHERHYRNWELALNNWNRLILPDGVAVWNVSQESRIESFPKISWPIAASRLKLPPTAIVTVLACGGEYDERHVEWLQRQIGFPVLCITDSKQPMKNVISVPLIHRFPGWWAKMEMFRDDLCLGNFLYVDLDTVIIGGIPDVFRTMTETQVLSDVYGQPWIGSGIMFLHHSSRSAIWKSFSADPEKAMRESGPGGDQIFLNRFLSKSKRLQDTLPGQIISYKADVLLNRFHKPNSGSLTTARFVCFHGKPRPWQVQASWVPSL